jgi:hypothetical protein
VPGVALGAPSPVFVTVDSKGIRVSVSLLESTVVGSSVSVDSTGVASKRNGQGGPAVFVLTKRKSGRKSSAVQAQISTKRNLPEELGPVKQNFGKSKQGRSTKDKSGKILGVEA